MTGKEKARQNVKRYYLMGNVIKSHIDQLKEKLKSGADVIKDLEFFQIAIESWSCNEENEELLKELNEYEEELANLIKFPKSEDIDKFLKDSSSRILCRIVKERINVEELLKLYDVLHEMLDKDVPMPKVINVEELINFMDNCC